MKNDDIGRYTESFGLSLAVTVLFSTLLVIVKELSEHTVMAWMKRVTVHHWVTHAIIDLIIFVALGFLLTRFKVSSKALVTIIVAAVVIGGFTIAGFYLYME